MTRVPATAGTDKMFNTQIVGAVPTHVHVEGEFGYEPGSTGFVPGFTLHGQAKQARWMDEPTPT